jgi:hypothetical protein
LEEEIAVMQQQHDKAAGLLEMFSVPGGIPYPKYVGNIGERSAETLLGKLFPRATISNANNI